MRSKFSLYVVAMFVAAFSLAIAGCGDDDGGGGGGSGEQVSGNLSISGVWTGQEARSFNAVLDGFKQEQPDVTVKYNPVGDQIPTVLSTAVQGGNPPDLAAVAQPGLVRDFVEKNALKPLDFAESTINDNFSEGAVEAGTVDGKPYGVLFKAANKSTVWYNVPLFEEAGVEPPEDFDAFLEAAKTLRASGTKAYSIGAADGWTLTDMFENIYLRQAGPEKYDQLATHDIPWTDQSVKDALKTMARIVGDTGNIVGGTSGALETDFPTSVTNAFKDNPEGAQVLEGDFVESVITDSTPAKPETGFNVFDFPSIDGSGPSVVGGGDTIIMFERLARLAGAGRVPRDPGGGGDLGEAGRLLEREQERGRRRVRGPAAAGDRDRDRRCGDVPLRPLRPPAGSVRRDGGAGSVEGVPGLPQEPRRRGRRRGGDGALSSESILR